MDAIVSAESAIFGFKSKFHVFFRKKSLRRSVVWNHRHLYIAWLPQFVSTKQGLRLDNFSSNGQTSWVGCEIVWAGGEFVVWFWLFGNQVRWGHNSITQFANETRFFPSLEMGPVTNHHWLEPIAAQIFCPVSSHSAITCTFDSKPIRPENWKDLKLITIHQLTVRINEN